MNTRAVLGVVGGAGAVVILGQVVAVPGAASKQVLDAASSGPSLGQQTAEFVPTGSGPDVIVGDLPDVTRWATDATETAYSVATTSCNVGDVPLDWIDEPSNRHPVIGQNLYRLKDGRFEQVGQSWLKHGFCALQLPLAGCGNCPQDWGCLDHLDPGCSDPYAATRNGTQTGLGPKWQVNPATGVFPVPWNDGEGTTGSFRRRLRVQNVDLANPGALYFIEGQYVTQDDAAAGNQNNNASYRQVNVAASNFDLTFVGDVVREQAGVYAWQANDPGVTIKNVDVAGDGRFTLAYKTTDNGDGTWHYEYALYNMNSDLSGRSFSVEVGDANLTNIEFKDVPYHSGDGIGGTNYDDTDWVANVDGGVLTWEIDPGADGENANALRWGTLYNFRFDADAGPKAVNAEIGLFKAAMAANVATEGPDATVNDCPADVDGSGAVEFNDLLQVLSSWGPCPGCPADIDGNTIVDFNDLLALLSAWGPC